MKGTKDLRTTYRRLNTGPNRNLMDQLIRATLRILGGEVVAVQKCIKDDAVPRCAEQSQKATVLTPLRKQTGNSLTQLPLWQHDTKGGGQKS